MSLTAEENSKTTSSVSPAPTQDDLRIARLVRSAARRHWAFVVLLVAGLALRVTTQLAYRPALLYIDSTKYLLSGLERFDPEGYRILLRPVLWFGDLGVVAAVQHVLGMAMATALYVLLIRRGAPRWAAVLAAAPVLFDAYQLQIEQTVMPEVMFETLIVAAMVILLWNRRLGLAPVVAGLVLGASATVRQVGEVLIAPVLVFVLLEARGWRRRAGHAAFLTASFALPILVYMTCSATLMHGRFALSDLNDAELYGRTAAAADCPALRIPAYERPLCPSPAMVSALGVDGLANSPTAPSHTYRPPKGVDGPKATKQFSYSVLEQQPLKIISSIAGDAVKLFALTRHTEQGDPPISRWQFQFTYPTYPPAISVRSARGMIQNTGGGGGPAVVRPLAVLLRDYQLHGGHTPGPYFLLALLTGVGGIASYRRGHSGRAALTCLPATGLGVTVLLGADLYEFSWRYQLPALITLPTAGAFGATVITARIRSAGDGG